jgi:predicted acyl esterase
MEIYASSSARDTDFTAKVVGVSPDGFAMSLTDEFARALPKFSEPARIDDARQTYKMTIDLWATSNLFRAGHRIRLEVSSSNFP